MPIQHVCVCDYLVHILQLYICDVHVVGAHDVCFTIHLRATFHLRLFDARGPPDQHTPSRRINVRGSGTTCGQSFHSFHGQPNTSCVQGVLVFPLHLARYEPVSTYLGPHSRRTHVPLVRHPPSLDIKANRNAPAIRRLAWEHQAK